LTDLQHGKLSVDSTLSKYLDKTSPPTLAKVIDQYIDRKLINHRKVSYKAAMEQVDLIKKTFKIDMPIFLSSGGIITIISARIPVLVINHRHHWPATAEL
jgi:hypothetical protein